MSGSIGIPLLGNNTAPGNYLFETDNSFFSQPLQGNLVASVFYAKQGSLLPKIITSPKSYINEYGAPDPSVNYAHYCNLVYIEAGYPIIAKRVVSDTASYSWSQFLSNNLVFNGANSDVYSNYGIEIPYESLQVPAYDSYYLSSVLLKVSPTITSISLSVVVAGTTYSLGPIVPSIGSTYVTSAQIANSISGIMPQVMAQAEALNIINGVGGVKGAVNEGTATTFTYNGDSYINVTFPQPLSNDFDIQVDNTQLMLLDYGDIGVSYVPPASITTPSPYLFQVIAKAPGSYYSNVSYNITNFDPGSPQVLNLIFSKVPDSYTYFDIEFMFNGVSYTVSATNTGISGLADALNTWLNDNVNLYNTNLTAPPPGWPNNSIFGLGGSGDSNLTGYYATVDSTGLVLTIGCNGVAVPSTVQNGPITDISISTINGSTYTGSVSVQQTTTQIESSLEFDFNVYYKGSPFPIETFRVSFNRQLDRAGNQQYLESVINNSITGSKFLRVVVNPYYPPDPYSVLLKNYTSKSLTANFSLGGGFDGVVPSNNDIAVGWNDFSDADSIPANILIDAGYSSPIVQQAIDTIATGRGDCETILGIPSSYQSTAQEAISYRKSLLNINSSRSTIYGPDLLINDPYTGEPQYIPPCGKVSIAWSRTDAAAGPWQTPANEYGILHNVLGLRYKYNKTDRGLLNSAGINIIKQEKNGTILIYGGKTLLTSPSLLQFISIRRMLTYCELLILQIMGLVDFLNITPQIETRVAQAIRSQLNIIKKANGLSNFRVNVASVNTSEYTNNGQLNIQVIVVPFVPGQYAVLDAVITNSTATFSESTVGNL